jgi:hypothetical protein
LAVLENAARVTNNVKQNFLVMDCHRTV